MNHLAADLAWRPPIYSTARLDALVCPLLVRRDALETALATQPRLRLATIRDVPAELHPVILEVWRVNDGSIEFAGQPLHAWWEMAGEWWGRLLGNTMGNRPGATPWGRMARGMSEANSRVIGTYNEVLATVPCVLDVARGSVDVSFVLRASTDSPFSLVGERFFGWGYQKTAAQGRFGSDGSLDLETAPGQAMRISISPAEAAAAAPARVIEIFTRPLLGVRTPGQLMLSYLDRTFTHPTVDVRGVGVQLDGLTALHRALADAPTTVAASGPATPWGAFRVTGLPSTLSYPRAL